MKILKQQIALAIITLLSTLLAVFSSSAIALSATAASATDIVGDWVLFDGSAVVRIQQSNDGHTFEGRVQALLNPEFLIIDGYGKAGQPRVDINNPDEDLRQRPVVGILLTQQLKFKNNKWQGRIYDPGSGKTYRCNISILEDGSLKVRGFVGASMFGRTMFWVPLDVYRKRVNLMLSDLS